MTNYKTNIGLGDPKHAQNEANFDAKHHQNTTIFDEILGPFYVHFEA